MLLLERAGHLSEKFRERRELLQKGTTLVNPEIRRRLEIHGLVTPREVRQDSMLRPSPNTPLVSKHRRENSMPENVEVNFSRILTHEDLEIGDRSVNDSILRERLRNALPIPPFYHSHGELIKFILYCN